MHLLAFLGFDPDHVMRWLQAGGYGVLFGLLFACGLGLPCPEDIPLFTAGVLIARGHMHVAIAAPIAWLGIIGGDCVLYYLGRSYGANITRAPLIGRHVTVARLKRAEQLFEKYGIWVVAVGRMFAGIRGAMVVAAGTTRFKFYKFIIADGLAAIVSGGMFMAIGIWFGSNLDVMAEKVHKFKTVLTIVSVIIAALLIAYFWWRNKKHESEKARQGFEPVAVSDKIDVPGKPNSLPEAE